jgi:hypothetical protein
LAKVSLAEPDPNKLQYMEAVMKVTGNTTIGCCVRSDAWQGHG